MAIVRVITCDICNELLIEHDSSPAELLCGWVVVTIGCKACGHIQEVSLPSYVVEERGLKT